MSGIPATVSLLCLPWAGASANVYWRWQRKLPSWIQVVPLELLGRGIRTHESFVTDFGVLVCHLCQQHEVRTRAPYVLFGHSMGALLAYGMAHHWRLQARAMPSLLIASASPGPSRRDPDEQFTRQSDADLIADLHKRGGMPPDVMDDAEMLAMTLATLRADYRVCASFRHSQPMPLACPIQVFAGTKDEIEPDRVRAWQSETSADFSVQWFEGGHFFVRSQEAAVLAALVKCMSDQSREHAHVSAVLA